ncbi:hypothetical protein NKDENANG_04015 [Candidatus Entotheonellaceae bacterium PAL068K]
MRLSGRTDTLHEMARTEILVRGVLIVVVIGQGHADQRQGQGLSEVVEGLAGAS